MRGTLIVALLVSANLAVEVQVEKLDWNNWSKGWKGSDGIAEAKKMGEETKYGMGGLGGNFFAKFGAMNSIRSKKNNYMPELNGIKKGQNVKPFEFHDDSVYDDFKEIAQPPIIEKPVMDSSALP